MFTNFSHFLLIIAAALISVIGHSLFRLGLQKTGVESLNPGYLIKNFLSVAFQPLVFIGFLTFAVSTVIWLRVLSVEPLSKSYPIFTAFAILFLVTSSIFLLREPLTPAKVLGMVLIVLGTFLVFVKI